MFTNISKRVTFAIALSIGVAAAIGVDFNDQYAQTRDQRSVALERARAEANLLNAVEWQAIASEAVSPELSAQREEAVDRLMEWLEVVPRASDLHGLAGIYIAAVEEEFALVAQHRIAEAIQVDETRVDPAFDGFNDELTETVGVYVREAAAANARGRLISIAILLLAVLLIGALLSSIERTNRERVTMLAEDARLKTEFIALASHELRTPLTGMVGFAELLHTSPNLSDAEREYAAHITAEGRRLTHIVSDLLIVATIESGHLTVKSEAVDIGEVIDSVLHTQASPQHELDSTLCGAVSVLADREKLLQVVGNLVENAVKYSPRGGHVRIRTETEESGRLRISVTDKGLGIPAEEIPRLFSRFYRVARPDRESIRGTGLGLWVVKDIVVKMGGELGVESIEGKGSTFWFTVPLSDRQQLAA